MQPLPSVPVQPSVIPPSPPAPQHEQSTPGGGARKYMVVLGLLIVGGLAWWLWQKQLSQQADANRVIASVRTHTVSGGRIDRTIRLTGATTAEKFVSLIAPQLRGGRGNRGRDNQQVASMSLPSLTAVKSSGNGGSGSSSGAASGGVRGHGL